MESLIKKLERTPVSIERLSQIVPKNTKCILYTDLKAPLFPPGITNIILLLEAKNSEIGHFVLLIKRNSEVEYWSSYGHRPEFAIKLTGNEGRGHEYTTSAHFRQNHGCLLPLLYSTRGPLRASL